MPRIVVSSSVGADSGKLFDVVKNIGRFPSFMKFVKLVKIREKTNNRIVSEWILDMQETPIEWTEEDVIDQAAKTMSFRSLKGDYGYEGIWRITSVDNGHSKVAIEATFDWGVPHFEQHFGSVYEKKARLALMGMLKAIKRAGENG